MSKPAATAVTIGLPHHQSPFKLYKQTKTHTDKTDSCELQKQLDILYTNHKTELYESIDLYVITCMALKPKFQLRNTPK